MLPRKEILKNHNIIIQVRKLKVWKISEAIGIRSKYAHCILHEYLDMRKLVGRWVLRLLIINQNLNELTFRGKIRSCFEAIVEFLHRFIEMMKHSYVQNCLNSIKEVAFRYLELEGLEIRRNFYILYSLGRYYQRKSKDQANQ